MVGSNNLEKLETGSQVTFDIFKERRIHRRRHSSVCLVELKHGQMEGPDLEREQARGDRNVGQRRMELELEYELER
jgi:hypothetical protein